MKIQIKYVSERGMAFDNAEDAISHDAELPRIIGVYENDLARMEAGLKIFGSGPVTDELKENWRNAIDNYKEKWEAAKTYINPDA